MASSQSVQACMNAAMDTDLAVLSVSTDFWEIKCISEHMAGHKSYQYRYNVWI